MAAGPWAPPNMGSRDATLAADQARGGTAAIPGAEAPRSMHEESTKALGDDPSVVVGGEADGTQVKEDTEGGATVDSDDWCRVEGADMQAVNVVAQERGTVNSD